LHGHWFQKILNNRLVLVYNEFSRRKLYLICQRGNMLYTPKHCCECGEKIDRSEWKLSTSRRFCQICESEFKTQDWTPRVVIGFGLLMALFGIGSLLQKSDKPLNVTTTPVALVASNKNQSPRNSLHPVNGGAQGSTRKQTAAEEEETVLQSNGQSPGAAVDAGTLSQKPPPPQAKQTRSRNGQNSASEATYFCGAQTKKGTPCTRRVKGGGRCWQHLGQPALLPQEKLVVAATAQ
jgi:hypothetical protein